jgi:hypothetical protein
MTDSFKFLRRLSELPLRYKRGLPRQHVIQTLFQEGHNLIGSKKITAILAELRSRKFDRYLFTEPIGMSIGILYADLKPLDVLAKKFADADSLLERLADIPDIGEIPFRPEDRPSERAAPADFIEELEAKPDTFHIGALIRRIWTGLAIPFHSDHPSMQPLGGVSDISNKGSLDKLLMSEHANDDILFLSRLANGEALYINRETPPETDKLQRIILIDSSLQSWGTPRTLAYALMLAIAHHPKTDIRCTAYTVGASFYPVGFSTIHELIDSLRSLDASLDGSAGIAGFFESVYVAGKHEVILISSPQGYRRPVIQSLIHEWIGEIAYCITADDQGEVSVLRKRGRGLAHLQSFRLPLKALWKRTPAPGEVAAAPEPDLSLPSDYPIHFPSPNKIRSQLTAADGQVFVVTKDNAVLRRWKGSPNGRPKGWVFVTDKLPKGVGNCFIGLSSKGEYLLLAHVTAKREVHLINLNTRAAAVSNIDSYVTRAANPDFIFWDDGFVVRDRHTAWKFHLGCSSERHDAPAVKLTRIDMPAHTVSMIAQEPVKNLGYGSTLKNVSRACISSGGTLLINNHELTVHHETFLRFNGSAHDGWIPANPSGADMLQFPDGSTVTINRAGMLILKSSNLAIGTIFIPSVLGVPIGAATREYYSGADFYNPELAPDDRRLTVGAFYERFIQGFITQIKNYAVSGKTG